MKKYSFTYTTDSYYRIGILASLAALVEHDIGEDDFGSDVVGALKHILESIPAGYGFPDEKRSAERLENNWRLFWNNSQEANENWELFFATTKRLEQLREECKLRGDNKARK